MLQGLAMVCLGWTLLGQSNPNETAPREPGVQFEFDLLGRFNPDNREQRLAQYRAIQKEVEEAGAKLSWSDEEVKAFASEKGLSFVHGVIPQGKEDRLTLPHMVLGAVLWKVGTEPPAKGKTVQVEARLVTGGDDRELLRRWRNTKTLLADQGFQEAYGYDHFHFQRLIGALPAERLAPILRALNKEAAGKSADFAPVALIITGGETTFPSQEKQVPPEGYLKKIPPDSRSLFVSAEPKPTVEGEGGQKPEGTPAAQDNTGRLDGGPAKKFRFEVILNRVVAPTISDTTDDLPWWGFLGSGIVLEARLGPILTVNATVEQARKIAQQVDVAVVRLPRQALQWADGQTGAGEFPFPTVSNVPGARVDYKAPLVVVIHEDFRGWEKAVPLARIIDLTQERNPGFVPDSWPKGSQGVGDGTRIAANLVARSPGTRLLLVRLDGGSPAMLGRVFQAMRGGALQDGSLGPRILEVSTEMARLQTSLGNLREEKESLFDSPEGDSEPVLKRKAEVQDAIVKAEAEMHRLARVDREIRLHRGHLLELGTTSVVLSGLSWAEGHPLDGTSTISRYIDDALGRKILWFQVVPDLSSMVWTGISQDVNHNQMVEFLPVRSPDKAHDAEFLPVHWRKKESIKPLNPDSGNAGEVNKDVMAANLTGPATIRFTLQWREAVRSELVANYPRLLDEPIRNYRLMVVKKAGGQGRDTLWSPIALADGVAQKIIQEVHSSTWEQQLTVSLAEPGEYAIRVEGNPARNNMPDSLGVTPGSAFLPETRLRIMARSLEGKELAAFPQRGLEPVENPAWLPVPGQARRAVTISTRPGTRTNPLEPDRRNKPELVVSPLCGTSILDLLGQAGGDVIVKLANGESPEQLDWLMHRQHGWLPAGAWINQPPADFQELGRPNLIP